MNRIPILRSCLAASALLLAACGGSSPSDPSVAAPKLFDGTAPDPSLSGPYKTMARDYDFGRITVRDEITDAQYETDVRGYIRHPDNSDGPWPVLLFLHGRHQTCETTIGQLPIPVPEDNCPNIVIIESAMSFRGYDYIATALASHGYAVLSIDANDINDNDSSPGNGDTGALARAELVLKHLDSFRTISQEGGQGFDDLVGKLDFSRVGLMGHSRGGEGVNKTVALNAERDAPHALKAVFALAPTDYNTLTVAGVPFISLAPYCDGDVEDLMGNFAYDTARYAKPGDDTPKFQLLAMGANHNYFNTVWTSDDWTIHDPAGNDRHCGGNNPNNQRDTPEEQRALGLFFIASFFRAFVGGEPDYAAYWNGRAKVPDSACPDSSSPCDDRYLLSVHAPEKDRLAVDATLDDTSLSTNTLGGGVTLEGFSEFGTCATNGRPGEGCAAAEPTFNTAPQIFLSWDAPARLRSDLMGKDVSAYQMMSVRIGVSHGDMDNADGQDFRIELEDSSGATASVIASDYSDALFYPPGDDFESPGSRKTTLNAVDVPLTAFEGVDLQSLDSVSLIFDKTPAGTVQLTDLLFQRTQNLPIVITEQAP
ncbi:MAG: poly(ethylene terephthalate) hydrolase family protein [Algiphilus sp.]